MPTPSRVFAPTAARIAFGAGLAFACTAFAEWPPHYSIERLGLLGPSHTGSAGLQFSRATHCRPNGLVAGLSNRYTGVSTVNGQNVWYWNGTTTTQIGLTDGWHTGTGGFQYSEVHFLNNAGQVAGISRRIEGVDNNYGQGAWVAHNGITTEIGLTDASHNGFMGLRFSLPLFQSTNGRIAGYSQRYLDVDTINGRDAWVWNGTTTVQIGLTGNVYTGTAGYQYSEPTSHNGAGQVAGFSKRLTGVNTLNGQDAWVWNGSTTTQLGFTGGIYTGSAGAQFSDAALQNAAGHIVGHSSRYSGVSTSRGRNAWIWDGSTTTLIGLVGEGYSTFNGYQYSSALLLNEAGHVAGTSSTVIEFGLASGHTAWIWDGSTATPMGLFDAPHINSEGDHSSTPLLLNNAGQVVGSSQRYAIGDFSNGDSAWVWDGTMTMRVGLTDAAHTRPDGFQLTTPLVQNEAGQVTGFSYRFTNATQDIGRDAWVWNGTTSTQIGLSGPSYTGTTGRQYGEPYFQNAAGHIAGVSRRYTGESTLNGQTAWYFDPATGISHPLIGSVRSGDNYSVSQPTVLTEDGFLFGNFTCYTCAQGTGQPHAFVFRPDIGFKHLGPLVDGGLTSNGWSRLQSPVFANATNTVVGNGFLSGQTGGQSVFLLTAAAPCAADLDNGSGNGIPDGGVDINDLLYFLGAFEGGTTGADLDDGTLTGTPDGGVDVSDLLFFLARFEGGC